MDTNCIKIEYNNHFVGFIPFGLSIERNIKTQTINLETNRLMFDYNLSQKIVDFNGQINPFNIICYNSFNKKLLKFSDCWITNVPRKLFCKDILYIDNVKLSCCKMEKQS
jgi:hypothetical protein